MIIFLVLHPGQQWQGGIHTHSHMTKLCAGQLHASTIQSQTPMLIFEERLTLFAHFGAIVTHVLEACVIVIGCAACAMKFCFINSNICYHLSAVQQRILSPAQ